MNKLLSGRRILVVEDEMLVLMMIEMMLEDLGCKAVVAASTVESALAIIAEQDFDLAMLDANLGGDDSGPIADALDLKLVPYLFCTGNAGSDRREGVSGRYVLRKPFKFEVLAQALTVVLAGHDQLPRIALVDGDAHAA
jgi:CheY-like chemotaxis protein